MPRTSAFNAVGPGHLPLIISFCVPHPKSLLPFTKSSVITWFAGPSICGGVPHAARTYRSTGYDSKAPFTQRLQRQTCWPYFFLPGLGDGCAPFPLDKVSMLSQMHVSCAALSDQNQIWVSHSAIVSLFRSLGDALWKSAEQRYGV